MNPDLDISERQARINAIPIVECYEPLVRIPPDLRMDHRYLACGWSLIPHMRVRASVVTKLRALNDILSAHLYEVIIWSAHRTVEEQQRMYQGLLHQFRERNPDLDEQRCREAFVPYARPAIADPLVPPPHLTGGTVDAGIVMQYTNELVDMGAAFDECGPRAHIDAFETDDRPEGIAFRIRRRIWKEAAERAGFVVYSKEWWHLEFGTQRHALHTGLPHAQYGLIAAHENELLFT